jgi:hypothetical protein
MCSDRSQRGARDESGRIREEEQRATIAALEAQAQKLQHQNVLLARKVGPGASSVSGGASTSDALVGLLALMRTQQTP